MSAYTDKVRPRTLRSGLSPLGSGSQSFEEGSHICFMYLKKKKKIEQCHKLLYSSVAPTRSYSEMWHVARIGLCDRGAVCGALKMSNCPLAVRAGDL